MAAEPRLLIVDDEPGVAITIQAILEEEGYGARTARSLQEARDILSMERFDAALVDLRLDEADGVDLLGEIRSRHPDCVTVMLTGYASLESSIRAIRHGAYDYLIKPCDVEELKLTVERAVERSSLTRALRERMEELDAANARIRRFADELQERVEQATAELSQKVSELADAKAHLEEAHRQREEFISMVAHELGQPLTTVGGYAQLLARPNLSEEARERARGMIVIETRRLARLVQDLADASNLVAGRFRLNPGYCDLSAMVREQVELLRVRAEDREITLDLPPEPAWAECDRDRLGQVLSNLLTNALKYAPNGSVQVSLSLDGDEARIAVSDEGPGVPPEQLETIFDPYVRISPATSDASSASKGAGLGLYIARGIVEAHDGRIWAENRRDKGATFLVCVPMPQPSSRVQPMEERIGG